MKKIRLKNVIVTYTDSLREKHFGVHFIATENAVTGTDSSIAFHVGGEIKAMGLQFNSAQGTFLSEMSAIADIHMQLDPGEKHLRIQSSSLRFQRSTVTISGDAVLGSAGKVDLDIHSDPLDFKEGLSILPDTLARKMARYEVDKPVSLKVHIRQVAPGVPPEIDINFSFQNGNARIGKVVMTDMSIDGVFTNHLDTLLPNDDRNSQVRLLSMRGMLNNLPMEGAVTLSNLDDPAIVLHATFDFELERLTDYLDTARIDFKGGHFNSTFSYAGKLDEYLDETTSQYNGQLQGKATIKDGRLNYMGNRVKLDNVNGAFVFTERKFEIQHLAFQHGKNRINIKGDVADFIPFFTTLETTGKVNLYVSSGKLDVSGLFRSGKSRKSNSAKRKSKQKISDLLEVLNKKVEFDIDFRVDEFINRRFKASTLRGHLVLINNSLIFQHARMKFAGGNVELNLNLGNLRSSVSPFKLKAKLNDVDIKKFFYSFKNFNQNAIRDSNIEGTLDLDISLNADINDNLDVLTPHLLGNASFTIQHGRLTDFEPMQRLSNYLFKGRDFSNIQFGEINAQIGMKKTSIEIHRMEIQSTALTMFVGGHYDLADSSDLSIQIPLSNLKKRDQDIAPENIGTDAKVGPSVFLRVHPDKSGKTAITYDPFKKFRKKK